MKRVLDHLRDRLERQVFPQHLPPLAELKRSEWDSRFEQLMRNRLLMGAFRYGLISESKSQWRRLESIHKRLARYKETGNTELLVDVANLCLLEFREPSIPHAELKSEDDGEHVERK